MTDRYRIRRTPPPTTSDVPFGAQHDYDIDRAVLGGQFEWFWGYPGVMQALASPRSSCPVPAKPTRGLVESHGDSATLGYWGPLHSLLTYRLGWSDPARGLMWWYETGKPVSDPTLALVSEVWDRDGLLDPYLSWAIQTRSIHGVAKDPLPITSQWSEWVRSIETQAENEGFFGLSGFHGGSDPLHLSRSAIQNGDVDSSAHLVGLSEATRNVTLVTDRPDSWYRTLAHLGATLPSATRSWKVQVVATPVGYLGTFRRSTVTSLWYACEHSVHQAGNPRRPMQSPAHTY